MAKITETTPKIERTFTVMLTEIELRTLAAAMAVTSIADREEAFTFKGKKLDGGLEMQLYSLLEEIIGDAE